MMTSSGIANVRRGILVACVLLLVPWLSGCHSDAYYDALAPSPTLNPHPHKVSHLKITVQPGSGVNRVEVYTTWVIGNLGCAPRRPWSGATIQKQVDTREKVEKVDSYYWATILDDRFFPGKCRWVGDGYGIRLMHDGTLLASTGAGPGNFNGSNIIRLTCMPPPHFPTCDLRNRETFDRNHFKGVFNASVEIIK